MRCSPLFFRIVILGLVLGTWSFALGQTNSETQNLRQKPVIRWPSTPMVNNAVWKSERSQNNLQQNVHFFDNKIYNVNSHFMGANYYEFDGKTWFNGSAWFYGCSRMMIATAHAFIREGKWAHTDSEEKGSFDNMFFYVQSCAKKVKVKNIEVAITNPRKHGVRDLAVIELEDDVCLKNGLTKPQILEIYKGDLETLVQKKATVHTVGYYSESKFNEGMKEAGLVYKEEDDLSLKTPYSGAYEGEVFLKYGSGRVVEIVRRRTPFGKQAKLRHQSNADRGSSGGPVIYVDDSGGPPRVVGVQIGELAEKKENEALILQGPALNFINNQKICPR